MYKCIMFTACDYNYEDKFVDILISERINLDLNTVLIMTDSVVLYVVLKIFQ